MCACVCLGVGGQCDIFNVGVGVTGCVGVVLAVNVKAEEGRNMSNVCAPNQSQKQCFVMFYCVLLHFISKLLPFLC